MSVRPVSLSGPKGRINNMVDYIDGAAFRQMLLYAAASIQAQKQMVNDLNVFPVPDGDTGTNMSLTMSAAAAELKKHTPQEVGKAAEIAAGALLRGARGNSGVILSLLFRGFSRALKDKAVIDGREFAAALGDGVAAAYNAVMKPAEGTILTVSRRSAKQAAEEAEKNPAAEAVLDETVRAAKIALAETIHQNPVLKKAGVIDAGGKGYVIILEGMLSALRGEAVPVAEAAAPEKERADFAEISGADIRFGYCTEFIAARRTQKSIPLLREFLNRMGDSLVLVDDEEILKVHVHTNNPGAVLEEALTYGPLLTVKVENMREQHSGLLREAGEETAPERRIAPPEKKYGFVSVCAGDGIAAVFRDLGCDGIISGGQTMNPSTEDILKEIDRTPAEIVYVLPNNKNIIMTAQQCQPLSDKRVVVLPTRTIPQGIAAMLAAETEADEETNTAEMTEAFGRVKTLQVTYAARDSVFDGFSINEHDYLALTDEGLFGTDKDLAALFARLAAHIAENPVEFITIYYGENVTAEDAARVSDQFTAACPGAEVSLLEGGQPVYYYMISVE